MKTLPLTGLRIVSFEQFGAAPYATMFLADLGAEVLKVESGEGDFARRTRPLTLGEGDSLYFQCFNFNKKSIVVDLKDPGDRAFFEALVVESHAVVNNLRGSLPAKLGLDYASLNAINPAIVCGHISAYGRDNSRADWPGYDFLMQAETGLMALTGEPGNPPTRIGVSMIDYMSGMMLSVGLLAAIRAAEQSGQGANVDVSLFDAAIHQLAYQGTWYLNDRTVTARAPRSAHPSTTPVQLFRTADGWVYVACMNEKFWHLLTDLIERTDLGQDPHFAALEGRLANRDALTEMLDRSFSAQTTAHWMKLLAGKLPIAPVYDLEEALENPFLLDESGMVRQIPHPLRPDMRAFANPIRVNGERLPQRPGPALGADTAAVKAATKAKAADDPARVRC
ncbi:CoA transferase [Sphingomonas gilva]|uniref:CoA transferase n=1 Tax=Sphingomonas gilva TaxID=2305907 RepID=A0A396RKU4_9SPHN|nr:CoA transferase [Sphingomonas gilva]RHW16850.1 CoA transferase [Sphingomonas gilva]